MDIQITTINIRRENGEVTGLQVYFTGRNSDGSINLNGYIPFQNGQYENHINLDGVENMVRQEIAGRLLNGEDLVNGEGTLDEIPAE